MSQPQTQPQEEWSHESQRWVQRHWDANYQRWYWKHYVEGQGWVFFEWMLPSVQGHGRMDSGQHPPYSGNPAAAGPARGEGLMLRGTYDFNNPQAQPHFETLDDAFYVRGKDFFKEGKVFAVLFTEPAGTTITAYNNSVSYVRFGEKVHTQVRRFIVVRAKREFCFAVPIFTYGNQGTTKQGVVPREHAVAYSYPNEPSLLQGETGIEKTPICIIMNQNERPLSTASRIYFGIHHPIQYNVKVKDLGNVHPEHKVNLLGYWAMEHMTDTNQAIEVTAYGADEPETQ